MTLRLVFVLVACALLTACDDRVEQLATAEPGVVFSFPADHQLDVPTGVRMVVTFSDPVDESALGSCTADAGAFCLIGPDDSVVDVVPEVVNDGRTVQLVGAKLAAGTEYRLFVRGPLAPQATNLPASGPLVTFTTRTTRPRAAPPMLFAINGAPAATPTSFRPLFETSTIRLVFTEPLDAKTAVLGAGAIELVDAANVQVPATVVASGIHVSIDPVDDLLPGLTYQLRLGAKLLDLGGQALMPTTIEIAPANSRGATPVAQVLRTRGASDPGPATSRSGGATNVIEMEKPLIGHETSTLLPSSLAVEMGDAKALDGPIAFVIRRGQRLSASGLDIKLGGQIAAGLTTGDIQIELLTDAGGRLYRNPHQAADQRPENARAPLYVELSMDVAVYAKDPTGNAVLAQTVLGVQGIGTAVATKGVLAIENMVSMELGLLGVTTAPSNLTLELITDAAGQVAADTTPPTLIASSPDVGEEQPVDGGIELIFDEPIDLVRARAGGIKLLAGATVVAANIESHGSAVVVRPTSQLAASTTYRVMLDDVADVAGNALPKSALSISTTRVAGTGVPVMVTGVYPGVPCALTGATATAAGRCTDSQSGDDLYHPFTIGTNESVQVSFTQAPTASTITLGTSCGTGSVRVEAVDAAGACTAAVAGTLIKNARMLTFVPDVPWAVGSHYRLTLVSGTNDSCSAGEICVGGTPASFDPLAGTTDDDGGGPNLVMNFAAIAASGGTFMFEQAGPATDANGSGFVDNGETLVDANRAALKITGTDGVISSAKFTTPDCVPGEEGVQSCMYLNGSMPVVMGELSTTCPLPDGTNAPSCIPITLSPQTMFATSVSMDAKAVITISTETGNSVMRIREPADGPLMGYLVDLNGTPTFITKLDLYMDAPDMSVALSDHDLHSKVLSATLHGPLTFLPDGRIAISAANDADLPVSVRIEAPLGIDGNVKMVVPAGQMKLQLISPLLRGGPR